MDIEGDIILREMESTDEVLLDKHFGDTSRSSYTSYYEQALSGKSLIVIAQYDNQMAGYAKLDWQSDYEDLEEDEIPEIKELYVKEPFRNHGIASRLMDYLETKAQEKSEYCAVGVGLAEAYEAAQHLFAKRGYQPDGKGVFYIEPELIHDELEVDDNQALMMIKKLS